MSSKVLDFERPGKKARRHSPGVQTTVWAATEAQADTQVMPIPVGSRTHAFTGPLDFPSIEAWLKICEEDFERGRDKHQYTTLAPMFAANGCTRIDDITQLSTDAIKMLALDAGLVVTIGLINRVHQYATEDVSRVKSAGKLVL